MCKAESYDLKLSFKTTLSATLLLAVLGGISPSVLADQSVHSLRDMVEKTISANPEVQARYHRFLEAGYEQDVARGAFLPDANIVSTYRKQEEIIRLNNGTAQPRMNNELVLRQMIFDGFAVSNDVKRLGYTSRARYYELQSAMQNIALEFVRAYMDTLRFRDLGQFAKDNFIVHKQLYDRIEERVNAGVARKVDLEQAKGRLALAESNLLTELTNLHDVTARMVRLYGEMPPQTLEAPKFTQAGVEATSAEALKLAYHQNPDLLAAIEDIQSKEREIDFNRARYMPRLDLQARKNLGVSSDGENSLAAADVVEVVMNFNLFNGFSDKNLIKQSAEKLNNSRDLRDKACVDTRQTVTIAYNDIRQLAEQKVYRERHVISIENAREAYRKQFDIGQRTLLDLLDTENEYFQAKRSLANAQYDMQIAYARVYAGQGELLKKIGASRGNLPEQSRGDYADAENVCAPVIPEMMVVDKEALVANAKPLSGALAPTSSIKSLESVGSPIGVMSPATQPVYVCSVNEVTSIVDDWVSAWRRKDTDAFMKFYADKFEPSNKQSRDEWLKERVKGLSTESNISVKLEDLQVKCDGDKASVKFKQDYQLTSFKIKKDGNDASCEDCDMERLPVVNYSSNQNKELHFEREGDAWKIVREFLSQ